MILFPFAPARLPRTDDADIVAPFAADDNLQSSLM
jgi:hypothetical protein